MTVSARHLGPLLLLLLVPTLLFPGALPGPRVVSADDHFGVHHAFRDAPGGVEVHNPALSDPAMLLAALRSRVVSSLQAGEIPLWNPDIYGGAPLLADGQSMVGSPVTWLHLLLPPAAAQDLGVWWLLVWTGLGTALLARRLRAGPWGAAVAGCAAMTSPYLIVWLLHPVAATFCWLPWLLWGLASRRVAVVAVATAGLLAGGHPATAAHGLLIVAAWWGLRERWPLGLLGLLAGALLAAPLWAPLAEQVLRSETLGARGGNRLPPGALLDLLWPGWWGHPAAEDYTGPGEWSSGQLHPGLAALGLALVAARRRGPARWLLGGWLLCVAFALVGLPGPLNHSRLAALGGWLVALAAGLAVRWTPRWGVAAVAAVLVTGITARHRDQGTLPATLHAPKPAAWTAAVRQAAGCDGDSSDCGRVLGLSWALQPNTGALAGLRDLRGYDLPVSQDTRRLMKAMRQRPQAPWFPVDAPPPPGLLRFAAVRVLLALPDTPLPGQMLDVDAPLAVSVLEGDRPRAWLASSAVPVGRPEDALRIVAQGPDARGRPPVEGLSRPLGGAPAVTPLSLREVGSRVVEIDVSGVGAGLVVLADAWAPGWVARIDGEEADCLRVGGYFRGVVVAAPARAVTLRYDPAGWRLGVVLMVPGLLLLIGTLVWGRVGDSRRPD